MFCEKLMKEPESPILGLHIEGPYLNPKMAGSQYDGFLKTPDENWNILPVSSAGISVPNCMGHMILQNTLVPREL